MAVVYQNKSETLQEASSETITITIPTGWSVGDLLIAFITKDDDHDVDEHTDWTTIQKGTSGTGNAVYMAWRIADTGDTNWTWGSATDTTEDWCGWIMRFTGHDLNSPIHNSGESYATTDTPIAPSVSHTDLTEGSIAISAFGADDNDIPYTISTDAIEIFNNNVTDTGGAGGIRATVIDKYEDSSGSYSIYQIDDIQTGIAQSFTGTNNDLTWASFMLRKNNSPTGNIYAKLYAHTGTYGTSSEPTGSALATSTAISLADITSGGGLVIFEFLTPYTLTNGTKYTITIESTDCDSINYVGVQSKFSGTHAGNLAKYSSGSWTADNTYDMIFNVFESMTISGTGSTGTSTFTMNASEQWGTITAIIEANRPIISDYYFNDNTPIDSDSVWTDDADGFDGSLFTAAYTATAGSTSYRLQGDGTNAPLNGTTKVISSNFVVNDSISFSVTITKVAQSFPGIAIALTKATTQIKKIGSPTGVITATLWSHIGTYGTTGEPNTLLATSATVAAGDIGTAFEDIDFYFSGDEIYTLIADTNYFIVFEHTDSTASDYIEIKRSLGDVHSGNYAWYITSWNRSAQYDLYFSVEGNTISKVVARLFGHGLTEVNAGIYTSGLGELLGTVSIDSLTSSWSEDVELSTPSGGWIWSKVQDLEVRLYKTIGVAGNVYAQKVGIDVLWVAPSGEAVLKIIDEVLNISKLRNYIRGIFKFSDEVVNVDESDNYLRALGRTINETLNLSELKNYLQSKLRIVDEVLNLSMLFNSIRGRLQVISEVLNLSELKNYFKGRLEIINEVVNVSELKNYIRGRLQVLDETLNISELQNKWKALLRVLNETVNISELKNYLQAKLRIVSETLNLSELKNYIRGRLQVVNEVINIVEDYFKIIAGGLVKIITETVNVVEAKNYLQAKLRIINETLNISELENKWRALLRIRDDTVNISELENYIRGRLQIVSEVLNLSELKNYIRGRLQIVDEVINTAESYVKYIYGAILKIVDEALNLAEARNYIRGRLQVIDEVINTGELENYIRARLKIVNEILNIGELYNKLEDKLRILNENVNIAEAKNYIRGRLQIISEVLNIAEVKNYIRGRLKIIDETINVAEAYIKYIYGELLKIIDEAVNVAELKNYWRGRLRAINEVVNVGELKNYLQAKLRIIDEAVNIGELKNKLGVKLKIISEVLNIAEARSYIRGRLQIINETINIVESYIKHTYGELLKVIDEAMNISELKNKLRGIAKIIDETINVSELKNYIRARYKVVNETMNISELKNYWRAIVKSVVEVVNIGELQNKWRVITKIFNEVVNISELKNYIRGRLQVIDETLNISETTAKIRGRLQIINEAVSISELKNYIRGRLKIINEILNLGELQNKWIALLKIVDETLNISDLRNKLSAKLRIINEALNIGELKNRIRELIKVITEALNIGESKNRIRGLVKTINEVVHTIEDYLKVIFATGGLKKYLESKFNTQVNLESVVNQKVYLASQIDHEGG